VNVLEVSTVTNVKGEFVTDPSGFEAVACMQRSDLELGMAYGFPQGYGDPTTGRMSR
jgi:hypothetical protein